MWIMWWYTQVFEGNSDHTTPVTSLFARGVRANYIRIRPTEWQGYISFRFEILGCNGELIVTRPISTIISTSNNRTGLDMLWDLTSSIQHFQKFLFSTECLVSRILKRMTLFMNYGHTLCRPKSAANWLSYCLELNVFPLVCNTYVAISRISPLK